MKTEKLIQEIAKNGVITEKEILLLKHRKNNGEKFDESFSWDGEILLTAEQNKKGIEFLLNLWKTPIGVERKNNPFGYCEQKVLETFENFRFIGFYDAGNYSRSFYVPLYECNGEEGSFEYYYSGGEVNIV
jgi:hypothetical protein